MSFFGQSGVVFGAALKVCLLAFQLALAICKKSGAFFCIDEDQRNTLIVIKKREMLIDAPIVGYRQISQAVFIVKSVRLYCCFRRIGSGLRPFTGIDPKRTPVGR